jgi:transcriptional regulator with XRE-family HTH domain
MSQVGLGKRIGTDQAHISRIERGARMDMSIQTLEKLADALGVSTDYLLGRDDANDDESRGRKVTLAVKWE